MVCGQFIRECLFLRSVDFQEESLSRCWLRLRVGQSSVCLPGRSLEVWTSPVSKCFVHTSLWQKQFSYLLI